MKWIINLFTSSIGQKLVMSLTGIFLITFLPVHLLGNLQLLADDGGESFNVYAKFMTGNPVIKALSWGLYLFILLHIVQGFALWYQNRNSRESRYAVKATVNSSWASRNMGPLGMILLIFLIIHLVQFWFKMHFGTMEVVDIDGAQVKDLYASVFATFKNIWFVIFYVVCMIAIGFHLSHGFQSAFQSLGLNHKKYTPLIKGLGLAYSILIPLGYAYIPLKFYFSIN